MTSIVDAALNAAGQPIGPETRSKALSAIQQFNQAYYTPDILKPGADLSPEAAQILFHYQGLRQAGLSDVEAWRELGIPPDLIPDGTALEAQ